MKKIEEYQKFLSLFNFRKEMKGFVGIERERFLTNSENSFVPEAEKFLLTIDNPLWTYELSACQVEDRTNPFRDIKEIRKALIENDSSGEAVAGKLGLHLRTIEVGPEDMPLAVYPDRRYLRIVSKISRECLSAGCRVTSVQLHFGMPNLERAIETANALREHLSFLCQLGDHSQGKRLLLYKKMAPNWQPPEYQNIEHFFETARQQGFSQNPRNCWHLIRISIHGTVELRMFGVTEDLEEISSWIETARKIIGS